MARYHLITETNVSTIKLGNGCSFNQPEYFLSYNPEKILRYLLVDNDEKQIKATAQFFIFGDVATSALFSPYGYPEIDKSISDQVALGWLAQAIQELNHGGVRRIKIISPPRFYPYSKSLDTLLLELGFKVEETKTVLYQECEIDVNTSFTIDLDSEMDVNEVFNLLEINRNANPSFPYLSKEEFFHLMDSHQEYYQISKVLDSSSSLLAYALVSKASPSIVYLHEPLWAEVKFDSGMKSDILKTIANTYLRFENCHYIDWGNISEMYGDGKLLRDERKVYELR